MRDQAEALADGPAAAAVSHSEEYGWAEDPDWTPTMETAVDDMMTNIVLEGNDPEAEFDNAVATIQAELDGLFG